MKLELIKESNYFFGIIFIVWSLLMIILGIIGIVVVPLPDLLQMFPHLLSAFFQILISFVLILIWLFTWYRLMEKLLALELRLSKVETISK